MELKNFRNDDTFEDEFETYGTMQDHTQEVGQFLNKLFEEDLFDFKGV